MINSDLFYFSYSDAPPQDGGSARNHAFLIEMRKRNAKIYNHTSVSLFYRIWSTIRNSLLLLKCRRKKILILQTVLLKFIFPFALFKYAWYRHFVQIILGRVSNRNQLYIEINDLIYEQSLDLGISISASAQAYQRFIFSQDKIRFIFASKLMGEYAVAKYGLKTDRFQTVINGAPELDSSMIHNLKIWNPEKIKYIYAGTLNQGREIEEFIKVFAKCENVNLILIGIEGEWLKQLKYENIFYLGEFDEKTALSIASQCDIGIIPYNKNKLYYNICYPTKNSFYIAANLPILSTPLEETMRVFGEVPGIACFKEMGLWSQFIMNTSADDILHMKNAVKIYRQKFLWKNLLAQMKID